MSLLDAATGIVNASQPLAWLLVGGQPSVADLAALRASGLRRVIDIRDAMEPRTLDEPAEANALGIEYVNAPVVSGALDDATMDRVLRALRDARGEPTLLHCNSANRTGGPLIAWLILDERRAEADAVAVAMKSGLRSVEVLEWATDYARRKPHHA